MHDIDPTDARGSDTPENYSCAKETSPSERESVYMSETESFKDRISNHNELPCSRHNESTHIHIRIRKDDNSRLDEEASLPVINKTP